VLELVHVSSPSYDRQNCSATCRRNISSRVDVSININTTPSLLPNYRKLFLSLFYFFCKPKGRSNIGKTLNGPAHIRKGRRSADRPPIGIEVEQEVEYEKSIAHVSAIFLLPVFEKNGIVSAFQILCTV